jgi:hypothetical protein
VSLRLPPQLSAHKTQHALTVRVQLPVPVAMTNGGGAI